MRSPGLAIARAATRAVRRCIQESWLIDLLVLALAGVLVGVAVLAGLVVVSMWVPTPIRPNVDRLMGAHEAESGTPYVRGDLLCCRETR